MYVYVFGAWLFFRLHDLSTFMHYSYLCGKGLFYTGKYMVNGVSKISSKYIRKDNQESIEGLELDEFRQDCTDDTDISDFILILPPSMLRPDVNNDTNNTPHTSSEPSSCIDQNQSC